MQKLPEQSATENAFADILLQSLKEQQDLWEYTGQQMADKTLLFDCTIFAVSGDFGQHYSVPYKTPSGQVEGCLIFQVNANQPATDGITMRGILERPVDLNVKKLHEIPYDRRYLYSADFKRWRKKKLNVLDDLPAFADSLDMENIRKKEAAT